MKKIFILSAILASCLLMSQNSFAHRGRIDKDGCHKYKKANEFHCHDEKGRVIEKSRRKIK